MHTAIVNCIVCDAVKLSHISAEKEYRLINRKVGEVGMKTYKYPISEYDDLEMPSDDMDTDIRNWQSHLVKVRKDTKCVYCGAPISKGNFALSERGFCDGEPFLIHDCIDCADDLIAFHKGEIDSEEYYGRWEARHKKYAEQDGR